MTTNFTFLLHLRNVSTMNVVLEKKLFTLIVQSLLWNKVKNSRSTCVLFLFSPSFYFFVMARMSSNYNWASLQFNFYGCQFSVLLSKPGPIASYTYIILLCSLRSEHYNRRIFAQVLYCSFISRWYWIHIIHSF